MIRWLRRSPSRVGLGTTTNPISDSNIKESRALYSSIKTMSSSSSRRKSSSFKVLFRRWVQNIRLHSLETFRLAYPFALDLSLGHYFFTQFDWFWYLIFQTPSSWGWCCCWWCSQSSRSHASAQRPAWSAGREFDTNQNTNWREHKEVDQLKTSRSQSSQTFWREKLLISWNQWSEVSLSKTGKRKRCQKVCKQSNRVANQQRIKQGGKPTNNQTGWQTSKELNQQTANQQTIKQGGKTCQTTKTP